MDVRVEDLGPVSKRLSFTISTPEVSRALDKTYAALRKQIKLPGFRKGRVPRQVLEEQFGTEATAQTASDLIREWLAQALVERGLEPVAEPSIEQGKLRRGKPFEFSCVVDLLPVIELRDYSLSFSVATVEIADEDIEAQLRSMCRQAARFETVEEDRPATADDVAEIDLILRADGYPDHRLENLRVGIPEDSSTDFLHDLVHGLRSGEERTGRVTVPMSYPDPIWAGATCEATVKLTSLTEVEIPELDEEFAHQLGHPSVAELRAAVRKRLEQAQQSRARGRAERQLLEQLIEQNPFELPAPLVQRRAETLVRAIGAELLPGSLSSGGPGLDELEEDKRRDLLQEAEFAVRRELLLQEVAKQEHLAVTDEDRAERISEIAQQTGQTAQTVRDYLVDRGGMASLDARLLEDQALSWLIEQAR